MNRQPAILHVEDDPNDVLLIDLAFRKAGLFPSLQVVNDGEGAIDYLAGHGSYSDRAVFPFPELILLDLKLPRRSGFEVLSWLRDREEMRRLPVVVLTSSNQPADVNRAYDLRANSYLVKPSGLGELTEMVHEIWDYWLRLNVRPIMRHQELASEPKAELKTVNKCI